METLQHTLVTVNTERIMDVDGKKPNKYLNLIQLFFWIANFSCVYVSIFFEIIVCFYEKKNL